MNALDSALNNHVGTYVFVALALGAVALITSIALLVRVRSLTRPLARTREADDATAMLSSILHAIDSAESKMTRLADEFDAHLSESARMLKHVGLVRYDAFEDIAGQQSYSMCMLDSHKNGLIITYLTGKNSTRSYAVAVTGGEASRKLTDEEKRAMETALGVAPARETVAS